MSAKIIALFFVLLVSLSNISPASASKASDRLVALGLANLKAGQYLVAAKYFNGARQVDKKDARALYYLGVSLNRLGQHGLALESFQRMLKLKLAHRQLGLEAGWAAIAQGRTGLAIELLEPYVKQNPKNAKAREFLGRAYIGDGRIDDAERELKQAISLNPKLKPTSTYYLAQIAAMRGDAVDVSSAMSEILEDSPDSGIGTALRSRLKQAQAAERVRQNAKPWSVFGAFSVGQNDNAIGIGNGIVLPSDISSTRSNYALYELGGSYHWNFEEGDSLVMGYGLSHQRFNKATQVNSTAHSVYARYSYPVTDKLTARVDLNGGVSEVVGNTALRHGGIRPAVTYELLPNMQAELFIGNSNFNYRSPTTNPASLDRDSVTRTYGGAVRYTVPSIRTLFEVGYVRAINDADGGDFDYVSNQYSFGATAQLPLKITANVSYAVANNSYDNLNSQAPTNPPTAVAFGFARDDTVRTVGIRLSRPFIGPTTVFFQAQRIENQSNIAVYDYDQDDIRLGISATF